MPDTREGKPLTLDQTQQALLDLWTMRRGDRAMPQRRDFETLDFVPWMGDLNMLEVVDGGADFIYRVFATNVALRQGHEMTGSLMSSHSNLVAKAIGFSCYRETCRTGLPYIFRRPVVLNVDIDREQTVIRENLVLPLGGSDRVDRILVLHNPKAFPPRVDQIARAIPVQYIPLDGQTPAFTRPIADLIAVYSASRE